MYYYIIDSNQCQQFYDTKIWKISHSTIISVKNKELRLKQKLLQDELDRRANVLYTTLTKIETGGIKRSSVYVVAKIAKALNQKNAIERK